MTEVVIAKNETERAAKVKRIYQKNVNNATYKCLACGQYMHKTSWERPVEYCACCGAKLEWTEEE